MKKLLIVLILFLTLGLSSASIADTLTIGLNYIYDYSGGTPAGPKPWVTLFFEQKTKDGKNGVELTITNSFTNSTGFVSEVLFNISDNFLNGDPSLLNWNWESGGAQASVSVDKDNKNAGSEHEFDILLSFPTENQKGARFASGETVSYWITSGDPITLTASAFAYLNGDAGTYMAAAHIQGLPYDPGQTGKDETISAWIGDKTSSVPEPTTMLLFGTGILGLAGIVRNRKNR